MIRQSWLVLLTGAGLALPLCVPRANAQISTGFAARFEIAPFAGYQWGGSFETDALASVPPGDLELEGSFAWGAIASFLVEHYSAVEITYLRQDTDIRFDPDFGERRELGGFATNYIHVGGRQEFPTSIGLRPFLDASLGITIFNPKADELDSQTRFSFAFGLGAKYMATADGRIGLRADARVWFTPVPSGTFSTWCDFYGCFVSEGTSWVTQGQITGGIVFAF